MTHHLLQYKKSSVTLSGMKTGPQFDRRGSDSECISTPNYSVVSLRLVGQTNLLSETFVKQYNSSKNYYPCVLNRS